MIVDTYRNNEKNEKKEIKYTLYINAIGKKSNEIMEDIMKACVWWRNPRIIKSNYGTFRARKYSYLLDPKDFYDLKKFIHARCVYGHKGEVRYLIEDKQNIFIFDEINY